MDRVMEICFHLSGWMKILVIERCLFFFQVHQGFLFFPQPFIYDSFYILGNKFIVYPA